MIRGRRVRASAADGANGPPRLPTATGPTSPGPVPGPPALPELLMNKTRTFPTTAPFGRSNENRTHRASPVQTYVDPRWPLRCSRVPGSGPPSSSIRIARPSEDPSGPERSTVSGAAPLCVSGTRPSAALAVTKTTRARAALRAWVVDSTMGWNGTSLVQLDVGKRQPPWVALYHRRSMDESLKERRIR